MRAQRCNGSLRNIRPKHLFDITGTIEIRRTGGHIAMPFLTASGNDQIEIVLESLSRIAGPDQCDFQGPSARIYEMGATFFLSSVQCGGLVFEDDFFLGAVQTNGRGQIDFTEALGNVWRGPDFGFTDTVV